MNNPGQTRTAAAELLRSLRNHGVDYLFANLGTDHTPILEAITALRQRGEADEGPELVICPHEFVAMSTAHSYAAVTGKPQAVLVHVDVGTQNIGAAMHNAHRCEAPIFVIAGLAPVTEADHPGSRDNSVHYLQDTFDQPGIVREYCRWVTEYQPPGHPEPLVSRGLERATAHPRGPVYLTATREALETTPERTASARSVDPVSSGISAEDAKTIAEAVAQAESPLLITTKVGLRDDGLSATQKFAECAGAGVVEQRPLALALPRDHELHVGFTPSERFEEADLILVVDTDVPWVPERGTPSDAPRILIDPAPSKPTFPQWNFEFDHRIAADPVDALKAVTQQLAYAEGETGKETWTRIARRRRENVASKIADHRTDQRLTPAVLTDLINQFVTSSTIVIEDSVTSRNAVLNHLDRSEPDSYFANGGTGLGWGSGAAIGAKLAQPDNEVVSLIGDGAYLFSQPASSAWLSVATMAPTLTVIYDNRGWNAVKRATLKQHPNGKAASKGVPGYRFIPEFDLSAPAQAVDAFTQVARDEEEIEHALAKGLEAVKDGRPAVIDAKIDPV